MTAAAVSEAPLLTSKDLAAFVTHGFLRFDEIIPPSLCAAALAELASGFQPSPYGARRGSAASGWPGLPLDSLWPESEAIAPILGLPRVAAVIQSLVGPGALYDHHYVHVVPPRQRWSQPWHADAIVDTRDSAFDIQLFFFFHDTPRPAGGTMVLPGSQFRRINESDVGRYQNFRGQLPTVCGAGTLLVCHHGIWHCGQPNHTDNPRSMLKIRLNPAVPQVRLWDTSDLADPSIGDLFSHDHGWYGSEVRLEIVHRIRLWRALTGDPGFDVDYWLTRLENQA